MKRYAPLLTLLAVAVLGGVLFAVNTINDPANQPAPVAAATSPPAAGPPSTTVDLASVAPQAAAPAAVGEKVYAGATAGKELTVAIAVKDGRAVAYLCDGKTVEAWLEGTVSGADVQARSADGTASITGTVDGAASTGTVAVNGRQWAYAAQAVQAPAGLYQGRADVRGVATRIGWIVRPDGSQTGVLRPAGGQPRPAPALDPADLAAARVDGVAVSVTVIDGGDEVIAR